MDKTSLQDIDEFKKNLWGNVSTKCSSSKWYYYKSERRLFFALFFAFILACIYIFKLVSRDISTPDAMLVDYRNGISVKELNDNDMYSYDGDSFSLVNSN